MFPDAKEILILKEQANKSNKRRIKLHEAIRSVSAKLSTIKIQINKRNEVQDHNDVRIRQINIQINVIIIPQITSKISQRQTNKGRIA